MRRRAIEPSEILLARDGTVREERTVPDPWIRFLARLFDYALFFLALSFFRHSMGKFQSFIPVQYFLWIPVEALLLWKWGKTPGKWFLRVDVRAARAAKPDFPMALRRSFHVWVRGIGLGIPIVNGICMLIAYYRLKALRMTSWDRDDHFYVSHRPVAKWRVAFAAIGSVIAMTYTQVRDLL